MNVRLPAWGVQLGGLLPEVDEDRSCSGAHLCTGREGPQEVGPAVRRAHPRTPTGQQAQQDQTRSTTEDLIHVLLTAEEEYGLTRYNIKALLIMVHTRACLLPTWPSTSYLLYKN